MDFIYSDRVMLSLWRSIKVVVLGKYMTQLPHLQERQTHQETDNRIKHNREGLKWMFNKSRRAVLHLEENGLWFCISSELVSHVNVAVDALQESV